MDDISVDKDIIHHLLFHKSLIDEQDDASRINFYVDMLKKTDQGDHIALDNPFDRSISIAFSLVLQHHLDPWDLDLVKFSTLYLKRAQEEKINLMTAGRIIYMAWKVLRMQSSELMVSLEQQAEEPESFGWGDLPMEMWFQSDEEYSYTNLLLATPEPPLEEPLRRDATRKVTLIELLDAFNHARQESEQYQLIEQQRSEERERLADRARKRMRGTAHEDHLEEDIDALWEIIKTMGTDTLALSDLCPTTTREDLIKTFMSVLFLAHEGKVHVFQKQFPFGKIFIKTIGCT